MDSPRRSVTVTLHNYLVDRIKAEAVHANLSVSRWVENVILNAFKDRQMKAIKKEGGDKLAKQKESRAKGRKE